MPTKPVLVSRLSGCKRPTNQCLNLTWNLKVRLCMSESSGLQDLFGVVETVVIFILSTFLISLDTSAVASTNGVSYYYTLESVAWGRPSQTINAFLSNCQLEFSGTQRSISLTGL
ncbi:hypothetical protein BDP27DRAFT_1407867 [Rhodocollybia butyracea]|uniref:Uncharacterized protein n=1 Tax=Rhodocollybia butyracea TaxID=206335 RepID=A0A9P5P680_9AGAR|nr:hypothetical protein BDP27DRAFT_1407867 [Rhodocollybia butyracea]